MYSSSRPSKKLSRNYKNEVSTVLMVKVRALEILKLRTTRNNLTKDRPTPPILASQTERKKIETHPGGLERIKSVQKAQLDEATG